MNVKISPDKAPVGPIMLYADPPKSAAMTPPQNAERTPMTGEAPEARASDIDSGIDTSPTVIPGFRFIRVFSEYF